MRNLVAVSRTLLIMCGLIHFGQMEARATKKLSVVAIGGNSECFHGGGTWSLYKPGGKLSDGVLMKDLVSATGLAQNDIDIRYFTWTGDREDQRWCLPENWSYLNGHRAILSAWPELRSNTASAPVVIVGWSNGGDTAYDLACDLHRYRRGGVSLLVTLDPVSWTRRECRSESGAAAEPARIWSNVYTRSTGWEKFSFSNIIALFGRAWNADFPTPSAVRPEPLIKLEPASHGDVGPMWSDCIVRSEGWQSWAQGTFGRTLKGKLPQKCSREDRRTAIQ